MGICSRKSACACTLVRRVRDRKCARTQFVQFLLRLSTQPSYNRIRRSARCSSTAANVRRKGANMGGPLEGVKVVEMGVWVAGPSAAAILCDWGADVIKIEPPTGDPFRGLFASALGAAIAINPPFEIDYRGKRSICIDLQKLDAMAIARLSIDAACVF